MGEDHEDEKLFNMVTTEDPWEAVLLDFEPCLQEVARHLSGKTMNCKTQIEKAGIRRIFAMFVLCEGRLYLQGKKNLVAIVPQTERRRVLFYLYDELRHQDFHATIFLV